MDILSNLNALRVFEVAARYSSFTKAAGELNVSQSAVSKQIALLESRLGAALFTRAHRQVVLTEAGHELAAAVTDALRLIRESARPRPASRPDQVLVYCDSDFAQLWLFPRLPGLERLHPEIRISIRSAVGLNAPPQDAFDCAIVWGRGDWHGHRFHPLMTNTVFPVAAPDFFKELGRDPTPGDVKSGMLIHDRSTHWWSAFRSVTDTKSFDPRAGRIYDQTVLCLEAAARGDGITIGDEVTTKSYLDTGRLVCPFHQRLPTPDAYYVIMPSNRAVPSPAIVFIDWLKTQARDHERDWALYWTAASQP